MTSRISGVAKNETTGEVRQLSPGEALALRGPVIEATLTVSDAQQKALASSGAIPKSKVGAVMFDTGASITSFDQTVAAEIGLAIVGRGHMTSASHEKIPVPVYAGKLILPGLNLNIENGMGANLINQGLIALIGRDVMRHGTLFYNGVDGTITFAL